METCDYDSLVFDSVLTLFSSLDGLPFDDGCFDYVRMSRMGLHIPMEEVCVQMLIFLLISPPNSGILSSR